MDKKDAEELSADHQRANRLHLTMLDMQDVRRYLDAYVELEVQGQGLATELYATLREALIVAAIVAYCRPFKKNNSSGQAVEKLWIDGFWGINPEQRALHELIMNKRDKFVAHSDWQARSTEIVALEENAIHRKYSDPDLMEGLNAQDFNALALAIDNESFCNAIKLQNRMYQQQDTGA